jgi:hypothetical protein
MSDTCSVILSAAKDPLRQVKRALTQWILRCAQDDGRNDFLSFVQFVVKPD